MGCEISTACNKDAVLKTVTLELFLASKLSNSHWIGMFEVYMRSLGSFLLSRLFEWAPTAQSSIWFFFLGGGVLPQPSAFMKYRIWLKFQGKIVYEWAENEKTRIWPRLSGNPQKGRTSSTPPTPLHSCWIPVPILSSILWSEIYKRRRRNVDKVGLWEIKRSR